MRLRVGASCGRAVRFGLHIYTHVILHTYICTKYIYILLQHAACHCNRVPVNEAAEQLRTAAQQIPRPMLVIDEEMDETFYPVAKRVLPSKSIRTSGPKI